MDWNKIKCYNCKGKCNKKGYPSVSKGSKFCLQQRGVLPVQEPGWWTTVKMFFKNKGVMRRSGGKSLKNADEDETDKALEAYQ